MGLKSHLADQALHLIQGHRVVSSRGGHHVFFQHDASKIIGAVLQAQLTDFLPRCDPGGLKVRQAMVQDDTGQGQGLQVFLSAGAFKSLALVTRLVEPRDES